MNRARLSLCALLLSVCAPAAAHDTTVGGSRWCIVRDGIVATIDLDASLIARIAGIDGGAPDLDATSEAERARLARDVVQPYVDRKLAIAIDGVARRAHVDRIGGEGALWQLWLSTDPVRLDGAAHAIEIDYRLLLDETGATHVNLAYVYRSTERRRDGVQRVFDFAQPTWQTAFERGATRWSATLPGPAVATRRSSPSRPVAAAATPPSSAAPVPVAPPATRPGAAAAAASPRAGDEASAAPAPEAPAAGARAAWWARIARFLLLGVEHILTGWDHIAFLLALIVVAPSLRAVLPIVTAFTAAHSITLLLAATRVVTLDGRLVESAIALSICWVAVENLVRKETPHRWLLTFCFGLVHGFGFASALRDLIVGKADLVVSVVSFNVGVELGQLAIFAVMLPVLRLLGAVIDRRKIVIGASVAIGLLGCAWVLERALALRLPSWM